ncbi:MAG: ECF transporter S component, partial [Clostridia bacterium]|nr:ECF transporter S component [Clostridia bacterium]
VFAICGMVFGPLSAVVSSFLVSLLEMVTLSGTGPYGALMNFASSASFAFFASLIYKYRRSYPGAVVGLLTSVFGMVAVMMGMNLLVTPAYTGMSATAVAGMIPTLLLPFNLTKAVFNAGISLLLYKPISTALRAAKITPPGERTKPRPLFTAISVVAALLVITAAVLYLIFVLKGSFVAGRA